MVQMAKDFATPSLNMSEENPSRAVGNGGGNGGNGRDGQQQPAELATFQLRRRWESRFVFCLVLDLTQNLSFSFSYFKDCFVVVKITRLTLVCLYLFNVFSLLLCGL